MSINSVIFLFLLHLELKLSIYTLINFNKGTFMKLLLSLTLLTSILFGEIITRPNLLNQHSFYNMKKYVEKNKSSLGSFQTCNYKTNSNSVHFININNEFSKEHKDLHKKISDAFQRGHFQSSGKLNDIFFDGVHFVPNSK